jgi:hypothetical protein
MRFVRPLIEFTPASAKPLGALDLSIPVRLFVHTLQTTAILFAGQEGTMDRNKQSDRVLRLADGIVVVLLLLANVAERMAAAPLPVRAWVLWAMRCADASAKRFAALFICRMGLPLRFAETPLDGNDREAVLSLASSMRILAFALRDLIAHQRRRHFLDGRRAAAGDRPVSRPRFGMAGMDRMAASFPGIPDTS